MIFNIATVEVSLPTSTASSLWSGPKMSVWGRRSSRIFLPGRQYITSPKTVPGLTTRMRKPPEMRRLSACDKGKMLLLPYVPGLR
eukprot:g10160.t1